MIGLRVPMLRIPAPPLHAGIPVFATVGTQGILRSPNDLALRCATGAIGFPILRFDLPMAPVIVDAIPRPTAETRFRRAMTLANGDRTVLVDSPSSLAFLILAVQTFPAPKIASFIRHRHVGGPAHAPPLMPPRPRRRRV